MVKKKKKKKPKIMFSCFGTVILSENPILSYSVKVRSLKVPSKVDFKIFGIFGTKILERNAVFGPFVN